MTILIPGGKSEAWARLAAAAREQGWHLGEAGAEPLALRHGSEDSASAGWVMLAEEGARTRVTVWLPDEGAAAAREALERALGALEPADGSADEALLRRLRRIEGQIRGLQRMIESGRECEPVLTQFAAVTAALKQTAAQLVSDHLVTCVREELERGGSPAAINQRLLNILF